MIVDRKEAEKIQKKKVQGDKILLDSQIWLEVDH